MDIMVLGPGLSENACDACLKYELEKKQYFN
jgi:hypothetical protein